MAQQTFGEIWNKVLLYAPGTPVPLAQQFVRNAYNQCLTQHYWSELLAEGEKVIADSYSTGTVTVTNGSTAVTGSGTTWTSDMENLQIVITGNNSGEFYTVVTVSDVDALILDRAYEGPDATDTDYYIQELYVEFPSDLQTLDDIRDYNSNWRLRRMAHQQNYIDRVDAKRTSSGNPIMYVNAPPRIDSNGVAYPRYEFWPKIPPGRKIMYRYYKDSSLTTNASKPVSMLLPETLVYGALKELALWPGTVERPNPFFSIDLHKQYAEMFDEARNNSERSDMDISQRMLVYADDNFGVPMDANWLQSHGIPF